FTRGSKYVTSTKTAPQRYAAPATSRASASCPTIAPTATIWPCWTLAPWTASSARAVNLSSTEAIVVGVRTRSEHGGGRCDRPVPPRRRPRGGDAPRLPLRPERLRGLVPPPAARGRRRTGARRVHGRARARAARREALAGDHLTPALRRPRPAPLLPRAPAGAG